MAVPAGLGAGVPAPGQAATVAYASTGATAAPTATDVYVLNLHERAPTCRRQRQIFPPFIRHFVTPEHDGQLTDRAAATPTPRGRTDRRSRLDPADDRRQPAGISGLFMARSFSVRSARRCCSELDGAAHCNRRSSTSRASQRVFVDRRSKILRCSP